MDDTAAPAPLVVEVQVADPPSAWRDAGFAVVDGCAHIGGIDFRLVGDDGRRGIVGWTVSGIDLAGDTLDGLATAVADAAPGPTAEPPAHPNGVIGLDHLVVSTPDLARTIEALAAVGVDLRRIRDTESYGAPMRQGFFRLGPTVLEVVCGEHDSGETAEQAPATWFGLAFDVDDLDHTASLLGDRLGQVKPAVQAGRRIATFRHKDLGMSAPTAAMDHHADR